MARDPDVDVDEFWAGALKTHWGIEAKLSALPGELDQNFLAQGLNYLLELNKIKL